MSYTPGTLCKLGEHRWQETASPNVRRCGRCLKAELFSMIEQEWIPIQGNKRKAKEKGEEQQTTWL